MSNQGKSRYIHGTDPEEQTRLSRLNDVLNGPSLRALSLKPGERVLDVGSGLGQLAVAMAEVVGPSGKVVGVERSPEQLAKARTLRSTHPSSIDFREGDALKLPLQDAEWASFDVAHARFLLEHVAQPQAVVEHMVLAVKKGGRVVLEDDDHSLLRLWPEPAGFHGLWEAYQRSYDRLGNDAFIGRRLPSMLQAAGAQPTRNDLLFWGAVAGTERFELQIRNLSQVRELLISNELLSAELFDQALAALGAWEKRPDATIWYAVCWAEARV
jgi:SAM-dependent methyltransferase